MEAYHDQFSFSQGPSKTDITVQCRDDMYDSQGNHLMQDAEFYDYPMHREFVYVSKAKYGRCAVPLERDTAKLRARFPPKPKWGQTRYKPMSRATVSSPPQSPCAFGGQG